MYRNGLLGLIQIHITSLNNMRRLLDRRIIQQNAAARAAANDGNAAA